MNNPERDYELIEQGETVAIKCNTCNLISYNPNDVANFYCGNCHKFHLLNPEDLPCGETY